MNINNQQTKFYLFVVIISILTYLSIFKDIDLDPIHMWDEATYANNSIDMSTQTDIFTIKHLNKADLYNTKPPFVIWMQAISIKIFGINEFAIRLPSAIFSFLTVLLVYFFCVRNLKSPLIGLTSSIILLSSKGYLLYHIARSGDLDAILVFWLTLNIFTFIDLVINKPKKLNFHLILIVSSLFFGFMSKGIAGFFFVPFMFIISLFPSNNGIYRDKKLYFSALLTLFLCVGYYSTRELLASGYLNKVINSELLRFNNVVMSWHVHPFDFYYQNLKNYRFSTFFYILPISLLIPIITKYNKQLISIYLLIVASGYFLLISYPKVKLEWYDAPLYPILAILISLSFIELITQLVNKIFLVKNKSLFINIVVYSTILLILYIPYKETLNTIKYNEDNIYTIDFDGAYLRHLKDNNVNIKNLTVFKRESHIEHYDQVLFYIRAYNTENKLNIKLKHKPIFNDNELVSTSQDSLKLELLNNYLLDTINIWKQAILYRVNSKI